MNKPTNKSSRGSRGSKRSITIKNNTYNDLDIILKEADKITLDSLDFNKTFKEQGKILCDIKFMLSKIKNNRNNRNNENRPFTCNPIISSKLNDAKFNELFQNFKKQYNLLDMKNPLSSRGSLKSSKKHNKRANTSKASLSNLKSKDNYNTKITKYKLNTRYPIVIIKKQTPRKNVIYLNK